MTHFLSCGLVRTSFVGTRSHPAIGRPFMIIGVAVVVFTRRADSAGSTRTIRPPWPLAATAMFPLTMNARPPNMRCSVMVGAVPRSSRMRSASSWS